MPSVLLVILAIIMFGFLIAIHEFGHFITAKLSGVKVNEFSIGMGPKLLGKQGKETYYALRLLPIGGYCAMEGEDEDTSDPRSFQKAKPWRQFLILIAGAAMNFFVGLLIFLFLALSAQFYVVPVIDGFLPGFEQDNQAQLMEGDRILSIDGHPIFVASDITTFFNRGNDEFDFEIKRNDKRVTLENVSMPLIEYEGTWKRGIHLKVEETTFFGACHQAWNNSIDTVRLVWMSLKDLITGAVGIRDMSGPVGIVDTIGQVASTAPTTGIAIYSIFYFLAFIAVNLAVMNLLPIPALDGGRVFFLLINVIFTAITKKKLNSKYEGIVNTVGFVALLALMALVAISDVLKLFGR